MTPPKSQLGFQLKTVLDAALGGVLISLGKPPPLTAGNRAAFMGSDGTIPESYARTVEKKQLPAWIKEGLFEHCRSEKLYALTPTGENRIK